MAPIELYLALAVFELRTLSFVSSMHFNLILLFLFGDVLYKLGNTHAS